MAETREAKTKKGQAVIKSREALINENTKTTLFLFGSVGCSDVTELLADLYALRKPFAVRRKIPEKELNPFSNVSEVEFLSQKNDCSLFCYGGHSKKRPANVVIGRTFDHAVLDMVELGILSYIGPNDIPGPKAPLGTKPLIIFQGHLWETDAALASAKSLFTDFFRGPTVEGVAHAAIRYALVLTATERPAADISGGTACVILLRTYYLVSDSQLSEDENVQRLAKGTANGITIIPMGPNADLALRRTKFASPEDMKAAMTRPVIKDAESVKTVKSVKNAGYDEIGREFGKVYTEKQNLDKLGLHGFKGLTKDRPNASTEQEDEHTGSYDDYEEPSGGSPEGSESN